MNTDMITLITVLTVGWLVASIIGTWAFFANSNSSAKR